MPGNALNEGCGKSLFVKNHGAHQFGGGGGEGGWGGGGVFGCF